MNQQFDVVVIGAGPGGYTAAIRAAQLGLNTACVDVFKGRNNQPALGGTCLNVGCIPSKALLQSSEHFHSLSHAFADHGISVKEAKFDTAKMMARKDDIVAKLTAGIALLFKKNKVTSLYGLGRIVGRQSEKWQIEVTHGERSTVIGATHVIIATGSCARALPELAIDNIRILDNAGALALTETPKRLGVIGAGVIGLEIGSVWKRLGATVTILEAASVFLAAADQQIAQQAFKILTTATGLDIRMGVKITEIKVGKEIVIRYQQDGATATLKVDKLMVAVGRVPNTQGLGVEGVGLQRDERGYLMVDDLCHTNLPNLWAVGDVVRGPMLAHKASAEGIAVAERIAGQKPHVNLMTVPWVIYTSPEIAWVGHTEEQLKTAGIKYKKGTSSFYANGRALSLGQAQGTVKVLADATTDRVLGVHMIGPMVSELITEAVIALEFNASSEDIGRIVHAHPTLAEALHEAALACDKRALHS